MRIYDIPIRYVLTLTLGINNFYILRLLLTEPTISTTTFIINLFLPTTRLDNIIITPSFTIQIIPACVAISAFYLLIFLHLSTPIPFKTRIYAILTSIALLLSINILRIITLALLSNTANFETIHWITWNILSTILVIAIHITTIKLYKITTIPVYDDLKHIKTQLFQSSTA